MSKGIKLLKFVMGILLVPAVVGSAITVYNNLHMISSDSLSSAERIFLSGMLLYCFIHLFLFKPNYLYVLGHELMHVIATWVCGGKVRSFKVASSDGSVKTTKSNFFISLAPYFLPSYVIVFSLGYFILSLFFGTEKLTAGFIFGLGAALAFHLIMTAEVLKKEQSDIFENGYVFSIVLIFLFNIIVLALIFSWLFEFIGIGTFFKESYFISKEIYVKIFNQLFSL